MKEFVVGAPYTTETTLDASDDFLIVACDGVSLVFLLLSLVSNEHKSFLSRQAHFRPFPPFRYLLGGFVIRALIISYGMSARISKLSTSSEISRILKMRPRSFSITP
jgi:protein phosphatase PTC1